MSMKGIAGKETVYVDVDDEITSIIDKVQSSKQKIVALVLPKRASMMQSIVNMRLLKRSADAADKKVVLITSEAGLMPLAGAVGLHVAKNLQSAPNIPEAPKPDDSVSVINEASGYDDQPLDPTKPVGELADPNDSTETIELDDDSEAPTVAAAGASVAVKKDRRLKIPNFDKFRVGLGLAIGGGAALIIFLILAIFIWPRASIAITTDSSSVTANLEATTSGSAESLDEQQKVLPSKLQELKQVNTEKVAATGSKDMGTKAGGKMTVTNCIDDGKKHTIPAGTSFTSGQFVFKTTAALTLEAAVYSGNNCRTDLGKLLGFTKDVGVAATQPGEQYNLSARSYTSSTPGITGSGSQMTGGTTKIVKVVAQQDVDNAVQKITTNGSTVDEDFYKKLETDGFFALQETATTSEPKITSSPAVGEEASETSVTHEVTYAILTVDRDDLTKLVSEELGKQIDKTKQQFERGDLLDKAIVRVTNKKSPTDVALTVQKTAIAMPLFNEEELKKLIAGKKQGDIESILGSRPGINEVRVDFSPFWVSKAPKKTSKISFDITNKTDTSSSGN